MDLLEILAVEGDEIKRETKIMKQRGVFGNLIESEAPVVVCDCVAYIRANGLYNEGVFRVNGNGERVDKVKERYSKYYDAKDSALRVNFDVLTSFEKEDLSVYDVASLLKNFFMKLEEPLIPYVSYTGLCDAYSAHMNDTTILIQEFNIVLKDLISPNRECLGFLISFLREVATFEHLNRMNKDNLSKIWCMSLMRGNSPIEDMQKLGIATGALRALIQYPVNLYMPSVRTVQQNTKYKVSTAPVPPPSRTPRKTGAEYGHSDVGAPPGLPPRQLPKLPEREI